MSFAFSCWHLLLQYPNLFLTFSPHAKNIDRPTLNKYVVLNSNTSSKPNLTKPSCRRESVQPAARLRPATRSVSHVSTVTGERAPGRRRAYVLPSTYPLTLPSKPQKLLSCESAGTRIIILIIFFRHSIAGIAFIFLTTIWR